jgi:hypothetical protein
VASQKREALKDTCLQITKYANETIDRHNGTKTDDFEKYSWDDLLEMLHKEIDELVDASIGYSTNSHTVPHELGDMLTVMGMILKKHWKER